MIYGIGIDLIEVPRVARLLDRKIRFKERIYTDREREYCDRKRHGAQNYAARFAAKEAFFKAVSARGASGVPLKEIEVVVGAGGAPALEVHGKAALALGERKAALSISHDRDYAVAVVMTTL